MYSTDILTLNEKIKLLTGENNWNTHSFNGKLRKVVVSDGPQGVRQHIIDEEGRSIGTYPNTEYPSIGALTASWDTEAVKTVAALIADECIERNVDILLAPAINIKRSPYCGRAFEYMSEDPYLTGILAAEYIKAVQSKGVGTSLKHFAANNVDYDRHCVSNEIDYRTLREIYLRPFEMSLYTRPLTVMCSYNPLNGVYASENRWLLKDMLRDKFGFEGVIVSDWCAVYDRAKALKATLDLEMPYSSYAENELKAAFERGFITEEEITASANRIVNMINRLDEMKKDRVVTSTQEDRNNAAFETAKNSVVLLKNEDNILPLKNGESISILGSYAINPPTMGGGSGGVKPILRPKNLKDELSVLLDKCTFKQGHACGGDLIKYGRMRIDLENAYGTDKAIIVVGDDNITECEGYDRATIRLANWMEKFIIEAAKINPNLIVVIHAGSAIDVSPFEDLVKAIVYCPFLGQETNHALSHILAGVQSPSAKLIETWPMSEEEGIIKTVIPGPYVNEYTDGIFVGYRGYEKWDIPCRYEFGFGLSYTEFEYSDLKIEKHSETDYTVSYNITNIGNMDASEISQLYIADIFSMVARPKKELKGFARSFIKAGETVTVSHTLDASSFAYFSVVRDDFHVENGVFEVLIGASSKDIRLKGSIDVQTDYDTQSKIHNYRENNPLEHSFKESFEMDE
ncbi:MAG: glycoside hydrolase family 3 C-terminal domain-containing protein [Clostridia bacterium]|nr:glycoside hydrolase family 3 C-terminal domain-containing protein [Clostridia bacterium]